MEDAYEPVAECAECLVVQVAGIAALVVVQASAGADLECAECPLVDRIVEPAVADMAGQYGAFLA